MLFLPSGEVATHQLDAEIKATLAHLLGDGTEFGDGPIERVDVWHPDNKPGAVGVTITASVCDWHWDAESALIETASRLRMLAGEIEAAAKAK
jgi:hypothetical protein